MNKFNEARAPSNYDYIVNANKQSLADFIVNAMESDKMFQVIFSVYDDINTEDFIEWLSLPLSDEFKEICEC